MAPEPGTDPVSPALEGLIARCRSLIRQTGLRHGLGPADLDEVFQEVRLRLWRSLVTHERIAAASPFYVYRTACSTAVDLIRQRRWRQEEPLELTATPLASPSRSRPDVSLERRELAQQLARALDGLESRRGLVVRMYLAGYGSPEIAEILGWTEPRARNLLYRGLGDLRARLGREGVTMEAQGA